MLRLLSGAFFCAQRAFLFFVFLLGFASCAGPRIPNVIELNSQNSNPSGFANRLNFLILPGPSDPTPQNYTLKTSDMIVLTCGEGRRVSVASELSDLLKNHPEPRLPLAFLAGIQTTELSCSNGARATIRLCTGAATRCPAPIGKLTWAELQEQVPAPFKITLQRSEDFAFLPRDSVSIAYDYTRFEPFSQRVMGPFYRDMIGSVSVQGTLDVPVISRAPHAQAEIPEYPEHLNLLSLGTMAVQAYKPGQCEAQQPTVSGLTACLNILPTVDYAGNGAYTRYAMGQCRAMGIDPSLFNTGDSPENALLNVFRVALRDPEFTVQSQDGTRHVIPFETGQAIVATLARLMPELTGTDLFYPQSQFGIGAFFTVIPAEASCVTEARPFYFYADQASGPDFGPVLIRRGDTIIVSSQRPISPE